MKFSRAFILVPGDVPANAAAMHDLKAKSLGDIAMVLGPRWYAGCSGTPRPGTTGMRCPMIDLNADLCAILFNLLK